MSHRAVQRKVFLQGTFSSSRLVRLVGEWTPVDAEAGGSDFAERLSLWFNAFDAIGLQGNLQSIRGMTAVAPAKQGVRRLRSTDVAGDLQQLRSEMTNAIAQELPDAGPDAGYAPYHQRHLELQRQMGQSITALRDEVRRVVSPVSPRLRQLAGLDAALEQVIAPREQQLLQALPALLERRFEHLKAGDGGLAHFARDWREALRAELDLRLEPVAGLVDALNTELKNLQ
jgi:hypothetical protein